MIDEWFDLQVDRLCAFVPAYFGPRMVCFAASPLGWHMCLLAGALGRRVGGAFSHIKWMEEETAPVLDIELPEESDPAFQSLDPALQQEIREWEAGQKDWEARRQALRRRHMALWRRLAEWWGGRHVRARARDERWLKRRREAQTRAQRRMTKWLPRLMPIAQSRFGAMLLLTLLCVLGVCAAGGESMGFMAAASCAMWLSVAFETDYAPVCGNVRQRYLVATLLRGASFLLLLPAFFGGYVRQGVQSNVVLQCAMLALLFAHLALYLALVAFNRRQPLMLRALAGLCGVLPALAAAAAIALATSLLARPMPLPPAGMLSAAGALLAFCADRLITLGDVGGIRLRYGPVWIGAFLSLGFLLMIFGTWIAAAPAALL